MNRAQRRARDRADIKRILAYRPTPQDTARHEAAHAVACVVLGAPFDFAEIGSHRIAQGAAGPIRIHGGIGAFTAKPFDTAVVLVAGPVAEGTWLGGLEDAAKVKALDPSWVSADHPWSPKGEARRLVAQHRDAIDRVALALLDRGRLSADEVAEVAGMCPRAGVSAP